MKFPKTIVKKLGLFCTIFLLQILSRNQQTFAQGELWGMSSYGGPSGIGVIFKTNPDGTGYTDRKEFYSPYPGSTPQNMQLTLYSNGKLYGTTSTGGSFSSGVLFEFDPATNSYVKKIDFNPSIGVGPDQQLVQGPNGKLYGTTSSGGGAGVAGVIFEYDPVSNGFVVKHGFNVTTGAFPHGLVLASNNKFYGTTYGGGSNSIGVLYEFDPATNVYSVKLNFNGNNGRNPFVPLIAASNGKLYGTTEYGGANEAGVLFEYDISTSSFAKIFDFVSSTGSRPFGKLLQASNGKLYGITHEGGLISGVLFEFDILTSLYSKKHDFNNGPNGPLTQALNGKLYGMASTDLYEFDLTSNIYISRYYFGNAIPSPNGSGGTGGLTIVNNKLYGVTLQGGLANNGVLFEFDISTGIYIKKIDFEIATEGANPYGNPVQGGNGKFYGMTTNGGSFGLGVLFEYDAISNSYSAKHNFNGTKSWIEDGPSTLTLASNGKIYGTNPRNSQYSNGIYGFLFEFDPATNTYTRKIDFGGPYDGVAGDLAVGSNGKLYGTGGGNISGGILYEYDPSTNTSVTKYTFGSMDGAGPIGGLKQASNGKFYGVTTYGGTSGWGVLFEYDITTNTYTKKIDFTGTNGKYPSGGLALAVNGKLYGLTSDGGINNNGILFEFDPATNALTKKFDFSDPYDPRGNLLSASNGKLYGRAAYQGGMGALFEFDVTTNTLVVKHNFTYPGNANSPSSLIQFKQTQSITFSPLSAKFYGDPSFNLSASSSSGLPVSYLSSNPSVATISGNTVTIVGVGVATITARQSGDPNYLLAADVPQILTVNKAILTATADSRTKVYGDANPTFTFSYSGFIGADNASVLDTPPLISTTAITTSNAGTYPINLTGGIDNNYTLVLVNGILTVNKATLTVTADAKTKVYGDVNPTLTITYTGFKGTDNASVIDTTPSVSTTAITTSNVSSYPITLTGGTDNNYTFSFVGDFLTVSKAPLTATADAKSKAYGDVNPTFTITYTGFKGADNASVIDTPPGSSTTAITTSNVGSYPITLTGGTDNNYTIAVINGALTINKASLTATADAKNKVYGDVNPALSITYLGFKGTDNASVIDTAPTISTTSVTTSNVGTYPITLTGGTDNNYAIALVNGALTINKANLTATADAKTKIYGDANPTLTITYTGFKGTDNASVIDTAPSISTAAITTSNVGSYSITLTGGTDNNYTFSLVGDFLTVNKAPLTATADAKSKVYGDANPAFTITYTGFKGTDNTGLIDTPPVSSTTATVTSNVGSYPITLTGGTDNNYTFSLVNGALTVNKATLTATADAKTKIYGDVNPTLTITYTGFKGTDNSSVIDTAPSISTTAITTSNVGSYPITLTGGTDNNYAIALVNGTITVNKATLTATADAKTKVYGDVNPALTITYTGFKGTDNAGVIDTAPTISTIAVTTSSVGSYSITLTGGTDNNYTFSLVNGTLTVNKATLTATADTKTKVYGDVNPVLTISYTGFQGTDNSSVIDTPPTSSTTAVTLSNAGTYAITLVGGTDNNYTISSVNGTLTITKAALTVTADPKSRPFGSNNVLTFAYSGFVGSDDATVIDLAPSISTTAMFTSSPGNYPITLSGGSDNNYAFSFVNSILTIYKEEQTIIFGALANKAVGDAPFILFAIGGPTGNPVTFTSSNPSVVTIFGNVATVVNSGNAIVTASQAGNINYNAALAVMQPITVTVANQIITFNPIASKNFGDATFDPGAVSSSGLVVTYTSSNPAVASIISNRVEIIGVGTSIITAAQSGNANYAAAPVVAQTLTVNPSPLLVTPSTATICLGTGTTLAATGAATYSWSPSTGLSSSTGPSVIARPLVTTTYTITATYANGVTTNTTATVKVNAMPLAAGGNHSVLKYCGSCGGYVTSSGLNSSGQLGDGSTAQKINPVTLGLTGVVAVATGTSHTLFLKDDGTAWATGLNTNGQLGDGTIVNKTTPVQVTGLTDIISISAGNTHSLFLKDDGTVWACGINSNGQLGDGTLIQKNSPVQVLGVTGIVKISAGGLHSLYLKNDGTVWATGRNANGQLGDGTTIGKTSPVLIPTLSGIIEVSAGGTHSHFLKNNGTVWATGLNSNGQLGNGTTTQRTTPGALATINFVTAISGGAAHTLFLRNDGTAWATGLNSNNQLGDGTAIQATAPVMVSNLVDVTAVDAGATHSLFLTGDGFVWAAGRNANGQLGDGTTTARAIPIQVANVNPCGRIKTKDTQEALNIAADTEPLEAYPNPTNGEITLDLPHGASTQIAPISMFDSFGKIVLQDQFNSGEATKMLNTSELAAGIYFLRVKTQNGQFSKRVIVVH